ncbi:ABC transporter ATP-binding protein [Nonomuraea sp. NPDC005650]|uniref:ABC transporter ATP-binding protein n=1 Tax=Nonomuraea sp. NPDC005650 TaxID=3157045 RepID=UPI0033B63A1C
MPSFRADDLPHPAGASYPDALDSLSPENPARQLCGRGLRLGYDGADIVSGLDIDIPPGKITVLVGANACGKSTTLRALARLLKPRGGAITLDGKAIHEMPSKQLATKIGILPQTPTAPEGITVADLVCRGRYPHQKWFRQWTDEDERVVAWALQATGTAEIAGRSVDELSGGQRQRVWIAMALAQETGILMLDEPTTYLDVQHQIDVLDLLVQLNREEGRTIAVVLHDLNLACRYAHHLIAMRKGEIVAQGEPGAIVTEELVEAVFGLKSKVIPDPVSQTPMVVPIGRHLRF